jgi:hypothetical protein
MNSSVALSSNTVEEERPGAVDEKGKQVLSPSCGAGLICIHVRFQPICPSLIRP